MLKYIKFGTVERKVLTGVWSVINALSLFMKNNYVLFNF